MDDKSANILYFTPEINNLAKNISYWRSKKEFYTPTSLNTMSERHDVLGKLMLVVTEVAEAAESVRDGDIEHFREEIADVFIRLLDISGTMNLNIAGAIRDKMVKNEERPPKHGRKVEL